jgi:hypothetical protein
MTSGEVVNLTVFDENVFNPVIIMCDVNHTDLSYRALFRNPDWYCDSRYFSVVTIAPIDIGVHLIILLILIIPLCCKSAIFMKFHLYLIGTQLSMIISLICEIWVLADELHSPELPNSFYVDYAWNIVAQVMEFTTIVLAAAGWAIHTTRFPIFSFILTFFCGLAYDSIEILPAFVELPQSYLIEYLTKLCALLLFSKVAVTELRECERYLLSYVLIVEAVGINPSESPVRRRTLMQYVFLCVASLFIAGHLIFIHIVVYFDVPPAVTGIVLKLLDDILMLVFTIAYVPLKFTKEDWWRTYNHEKFVNCAMEEFNPDAFPRTGRPLKWETGMVLPLPPMMAALEYTQALQPQFDEKETRLYDGSEI